MKKITQLLCCCLILITTATFGFAQTKTIRIATEATYPPFEKMNPDGSLSGFDIDLVHAICNKIDANCIIINQPFDSLIPGLKLGKFDAIIGGIAITPERAKQVDFTTPYYQNKINFVGSKSAKLTISDAGLKGKTIGVQSGTTYEHYLENKFGSSINLKRYPSNENALLDLKNGRIDACLADTPFLIQWLKKGNSDHFGIVGDTIKDPKYLGDGNAIAVKKGNQALLQSLNQAIDSLKADGTLKKLEDQYFEATP